MLSWNYTANSTVALAGKGLIRATCGKYLIDEDVGWTITEDEMLAAGGHSPNDHALVIDTAPRRTTVSLFQIKSIAGYSYT